MDPNIQALLDAMKQQQEKFLELVSQTQRDASRDEAVVPKFDGFDKPIEKWDQYLQRFTHHLNIYNVTSDEKKRACLLSWIGPETYALLENLFGDESIAQKEFQALTDKLSGHFKDQVHVQAAHYAFYQCEMQPGKSYADWAATLRGLARNCQFTC